MQRLHAPGLPLVLLLFLGFLALSSQVSSADREIKNPKKEIATNAYSLLYYLLLDEKDAEKILTISRERKSIDPLIKEISETSNETLKILEEFKKKDPTFNFEQSHLPPGEQLTREALAKTKTKVLLSSHGDNFSVNLLLTQAEALSYASHLASIASIHDDNSVRSKKTAQVSDKFEKLHAKVIGLLSVKNS